MLPWMIWLMYAIPLWGMICLHVTLKRQLGHASEENERLARNALAAEAELNDFVSNIQILPTMQYNIAGENTSNQLRGARRNMPPAAFITTAYPIGIVRHPITAMVTLAP